MTRILCILLAVLVLPACSTLPARVAHAELDRGYWHGYVDWSRAFTVEAPGRFTIRRGDDGTTDPLAPRVYTVDRGTLRFSIVAYPTASSRPPVFSEDTFDLMEWDSLGGQWPAYQRHVYLDGRLYRQRLVFADRMTYELVVSGPAGVFPDFAARRFFDSFMVMART